MASSSSVNDRLERWDQVEPDLPSEDRGLLLGNGASRVVWDRFGYGSLYDIAADPTSPYPLTDKAQRIFKEFDEDGSKNFEAILSALAVTGKISRILIEETPQIESLRVQYRNVRRALIHAVRNVHIPFAQLTEPVKDRLREAYRQHDYIYTTNYDLILYWSVMGQKEEFKDFFWSSAGTDHVLFDVSNSHVYGDVTKIIYLHGALHLYHNVRGATFKLAGEQGELLEMFNQTTDAIPLFISEGTWKDKMWSIRRNDYLSFAYQRFSTHRGPLVCFGHSLSEAFDQHLLTAMTRWYRYDQRRNRGGTEQRTVAIAMRPGQPGTNVLAEKSRLVKALPQCRLRFFDATTHPLGDSSLRIAGT